MGRSPAVCIFWNSNVYFLHTGCYFFKKEAKEHIYYCAFNGSSYITCILSVFGQDAGWFDALDVTIYINCALFCAYWAFLLEFNQKINIYNDMCIAFD